MPVDAAIILSEPVRSGKPTEYDAVFVCDRWLELEIAASGLVAVDLNARFVCIRQMQWTRAQATDPVFASYAYCLEELTELDAAGECRAIIMSFDTCPLLAARLSELATSSEGPDELAENILAPDFSALFTVECRREWEPQDLKCAKESETLEQWWDQCI